MEKLNGTDEMLGARAAVNESTISSLALDAEEDTEDCKLPPTAYVMDRGEKPSRAKVRMVEGEGKSE